jgi:hypothetical protein
MFQTLNQLKERFLALGAERVFFKALADNDNSKQQIYLGGSLEVLSFFPHGKVREYPDLTKPNFKADINFYWIGVDFVEQAQGAQLILYPKYPEVRLSGFLAGCTRAPSEHLQALPRSERSGNNGRILFFGTSKQGQVFAYLAATGTAIAIQAIATREEGRLFTELTLATDSAINKAQLLRKLKEIIDNSPHASQRIDKTGALIPYAKQNAAGYTLESLLGIKPNSLAAPDYLGWEIKSYSTSRITLMTPEPDGGLYGEKGVDAFVRQYGHDTNNDTRYFTGNHKFEEVAKASGLTLKLFGFDSGTRKLTSVNGCIALIDSDQNMAASWAFSHLLTHWNRKHAFAAYVPSSSTAEHTQCSYKNPLLLGEHTDFSRYLAAIAAGLVIYDPASKIENASTEQSRVKARSQFRISSKNLAGLYEKFESISV